MSEQSKPSVVFVVAEDHFFLSHRLPMANAVKELGYHVIVAAPDSGCMAKIAALGFGIEVLPINRGNQNPIREFEAIVQLIRLLWRVRPKAVQSVSLKPILLVGMASFFVPRTMLVNTFTGLGIVFSGRRDVKRLRWFVEIILRGIDQYRPTLTITQNADDARTLEEVGAIDCGSAYLIPGSGIDTDLHRPVDAHGSRPRVLMASRLLWDKGVGELVDAARILKTKGVNVDIRIAGAPDDSNPRAVHHDFIDRIQAEGIAAFLGQRNDVPDLLAESHIFVHPSYYPEGVPKCLLEAAASGLAIVTTDSPGCRDLVPDSSTGILVPPRDASALADAIERLAGDPDYRRTLGKGARALAVERFSSRAVAEQIKALYRKNGLAD